MRSLLRCLFASSLLIGCAELDEAPLGVEESALVINPTVGGPWGSLATCNAGAPLVVAPSGAVPAAVTSYMNNAATNWGHTYNQAWHTAASTGAAGRGAFKWYWGPGGNQWGGLVYWNNATQCAYYVPNSDTSCIGQSCVALANGTSARLYEKYAQLGWENQLGLPISNPVPYGWAGVTYQQFTNGVITYAAGQGAHYAGITDDGKALVAAWKQVLGVSPTSGPAVYAFMEDQQCTNLMGPAGSCTQAAGKTGAYVRVFDAYWGKPAYVVTRTGWSEGHVVWGPHAEEWIAVYGAAPWNATGFPLTNLTYDAAGDEYYRFENATLVRDPDSAHTVIVDGAIEDHWTTGDNAAVFGAPVGRRTPLGDGGFQQAFRNGHVFLTPAGTAYFVEGGATSPTLAQYLEHGGPRGPWGYPTMDAPLPGTTVYGPPRGQIFDRGVFLPTGTTTGTYFPAEADGLARDLHLTGGVRWTDLHWTNVSGAPAKRQIIRSIDGGPFEEIMAISPLASTAQDNPATAAMNGFMLRPDDKKVCYHVKDTHVGGVVTYSNLACQFTASSRVKSVSRLQIAIRTSTRRDSETDHRVKVLLQHPAGSLNTPSPKGNATWVDNNHRNFDRGDVSMFDLSMKNVRDLSDVTQLVIEVEGDDALCVAGVDLFANDVVVFSKELGEETCAVTELAGVTVSGPRVVVATFQELRAFPAWQAYDTESGNFPPVVGVDPTGAGHRFVGFAKADFISKLDSMVADQVLSAASDPEGESFYPRMDDGDFTVTQTIPGHDDELQVFQFVQANDGWWGDVHCQLSYRLKIEHLVQGGKVIGRMTIPAETSGAHCWTEGWSNYLPLWSLVFAVAPAMIAESNFGPALDGIAPTGLGAIPGGAHYCFGGANSVMIFGGANGGMDPQSFTLCLGDPPMP